MVGAFEYYGTYTNPWAERALSAGWVGACWAKGTI